ncbi:MAG: hypothetical protein BGO39_33665 [Chloroflexi bacterium 54-19]|nr:MAG: hypothetical protein BGO39_33665 [Chloroflexi bacterium 54-19]
MSFIGISSLRLPLCKGLMRIPSRQLVLTAYFPIIIFYYIPKLLQKYITITDINVAISVKVITTCRF